jgi:NTE family protein
MQRDLAFVMMGGGARAAYQVGVLRYIASRYPDLGPAILAGASAGAINAAQIASTPGTFADAVTRSIEIWRRLQIEDVFRIDPASVVSRSFRWGIGRLAGGALADSPRAASILDTTPLHNLLFATLNAARGGALPGINRQIEAGALHAVALTASRYATGRSVTWVQEAEGCRVMTRERPRGTTASGPLTVDHVMASAALPVVFPPVNVDGAWYGDGTVRLTAPLSPAIHLGARRIIAISTCFDRYGDDRRAVAADADSPADVAGLLLEAIFLDVLDADARNLRRVNALVDALPAYARGGLRHVDLLVLRPSQDLGALASGFERTLPRGVRLLLRAIGGRDANLSDSLSLLMFQPEYVARLIELGEADAQAQAGEIDAVLRPAPALRLIARAV